LRRTAGHMRPAALRRPPGARRQAGKQANSWQTGLPRLYLLRQGQRLPSACSALPIHGTSIAHLRLRWICHGFAKRMPSIWICHSCAISHQALLCDLDKSGMCGRGFAAPYPNLKAWPQVAKAFAFAAHPRRLRRVPLWAPESRLGSDMPPKGSPAKRSARWATPSPGKRLRADQVAPAAGTGAADLLADAAAMAGIGSCSGFCVIARQSFGGVASFIRMCQRSFPTRRTWRRTRGSSGAPGLLQDAERDAAFAAWADVTGQRCACASP